MNAQMEALQDYILRSTRVYRKGEVVKVEGNVTTIDAFPALPKGLTTTVDCHFIHVGFTEALARLTHQEFYDLVTSITEGAYGSLPEDFWKKGPSYIAIAHWLGDQTRAFQFMALVQAHGLGHVITPAMLGVPESIADAMAGNGYVLLSGLAEPL